MDTFEYKGQTGFQSACNEYAQDTLSLDDFFKTNSPSIYIWRASGSVSRNIHIKDNDIVIVDRKYNKPMNGKVYVIIVEDEFRLARFPFQVNQETEVVIWGGVVGIINLYI